MRNLWYWNATERHWRVVSCSCLSVSVIVCLYMWSKWWTINCTGCGPFSSDDSTTESRVWSKKKDCLDCREPRLDIGKISLKTNIKWLLKDIFTVRFHIPKETETWSLWSWWVASLAVHLDNFGRSQEKVNRTLVISKRRFTSHPRGFISSTSWWSWSQLHVVDYVIIQK